MKSKAGDDRDDERDTGINTRGNCKPNQETKQTNEQKEKQTRFLKEPRGKTKQKKITTEVNNDEPDAIKRDKKKRTSEQTNKPNTTP